MSQGLFSAVAVSEYFVIKSIETKLYVTQMKLQKMVYFAHGLFLAKKDKPLISENFEAWKFGPVVPKIYDAYKAYGSSLIQSYAPKAPDLSKLIGYMNIDSDLKSILNDTWETTNVFDAITLSAWSHSPDGPWSKVYKEGVQHIIIPDDEIKAYFQKLVAPKNVTN
jgi:uncharacterized phage-associated protein